MTLTNIRPMMAAAIAVLAFSAPATLSARVPDPPPNEAVAPQAPEAPPLASETLDQYADAYLAIEEIYGRAAGLLQETDDPAAAQEIRATAETAMIQAVEQTGLEPQEFNEITQLMAADPTLRAQIAARVEERRQI